MKAEQAVSSPQRSIGHELTVLIAVSFVVRLLFLWVKPEAALSFDTKYWTEAIEIFLSGKSAYLVSGVQQYPPFWFPILVTISKIANFLGVTLLHAVCAFLLMVEHALLIILYFLGLRATGRSPFLYLLIGFSLSPINVLQLCQHVQIDVIIALFSAMFCLYLVRWVQSGNPVNWLLGCACLGLAIITKFIPFVLCPLLCINYRRLKLEELILGAFLVFGPLLYGVAILFTSGDVGFPFRIVGYRGIGGYFGFTGIFALLDMRWAQELFSKTFVWFLLSILSLLSLDFLISGWSASANKENKVDPRVILLLVPTLFLISILFSSGYGPQYIMWMIPFGPLVYMVAGYKTKKLFLLTYIIACGTFIVEYSLFRSHGAFLLQFFPGGSLEENAVKLSSQGGQTLLRTPLFLSLLASFFAILVMLKNFWRVKQR